MKTENIFLAEENKEQRRKRRNIIGEGKEERRRGGKKLWSRKMYFVEEKKDGEGKGGKYMEKENVTIAGQTDDNEQGKIGQLSQCTMGL